MCLASLCFHAPDDECLINAHVQKHEDDAAAHTDRDMYREALDALWDQLRYLDKFISSEDTVIDLKPFMRPPPEICNLMPLILPGSWNSVQGQGRVSLGRIARGEVGFRAHAPDGRLRLARGISTDREHQGAVTFRALKDVILVRP